MLEERKVGSIERYYNFNTCDGGDGGRVVSYPYCYLVIAQSLARKSLPNRKPTIG